MPLTVSELLRDHVSLSIACIDRVYVNGWVPRLMTSGQVVYFLENIRGAKFASPALFGQTRKRLSDEVRALAASEGVDLLRFKGRQRKDDIVQGYRRKNPGRDRLVVIGVAQERCWSVGGTKKRRQSGSFYFDFSKQSAYVNHFYFYVDDADWGPAFLKLGSYAPYPVKLCLNGHEWAKRQLDKLEIGYEALDNGFRSCDDPMALQAICDSLGHEDIRAFFDRWVPRLPWPFTDEEREDFGYDHSLSIWQFEMSLTQVFDRPVQGRQFFEAVIRNNVDLGRPDRVKLLFPGLHRRTTPAPPLGYGTRVITRGVSPSLHVEYKRSHVKQYFKEERALRTETTINDPTSFGINKHIANLDRLRELGNHVNQRLLEVERVAEDCVLDEDQLQALQNPTRDDEGQRAAALRFGDRRVMALFQAMCMFLHVHNGFRNRDVRPLVAALLGIETAQYTAGRMTYDLRRLRRNGLIQRGHRSHRYQVTPFGRRVAYFHAKVHQRILRPGWAAIGTDDRIDRPLRAAFRRLDREIDRICGNAQLGAA